MTERFTGTIEPFAEVDVGALIDWLLDIPVTDWPKTADASWQGWGDKFEPIARDLMAQFYPDCTMAGIGMFVLEPGQTHPAHRDVQPTNWITRVHVPIVTNEDATTIMDDGAHYMEVGTAYRFNTLATHAVFNYGSTYRAHLVFDVHD